MSSKQSEIARQFDLPERQSKLNTMLREEGLKDEQVYCICRSADVSRFMIGCDNCEDWYHGDCINVTEVEANKIRKFYCKRCRAKFPSLQIKYKKKRNHHHKHRHDKEKHREKDNEDTKEKSSKNRIEGSGDRCGECEVCYIKEDCGRCEYCKDMIKFGGSGKLKQNCKKRQCQNFYHLAKKHQVANSKPSNDYAKSDHSYNSQPKVSSKPQLPTTPENKTSSSTLIIKSLAQYSTISSSVPSNNNNTTSTTTPTTPTNITSSTVVSLTDLPCNKSEGDKVVYSTVSKLNDLSSLPISVAAPLTNVTNNNSRTNLDSTAALDEGNVTKANEKVVDNGGDKWEPIRKKKTRETISRKRKEMIGNRKRKRQDSGSDSDDHRAAFDAQVIRQCMGPQCIKVTQASSKYCSKECGLKLAEARIYSVLPQRIQEWKMSSCLAEEKDRAQLEKIRSQQLEARKALQALDEKHKELDTLLEKWKSVSIDPEADGEGDEEGSEGAFVYCVTCGHEVTTRRAIKHMHSCFNKLESQMSFGSMFKTRIEGNNMFCDAYNPSNRTYCKRLRVMCPEHTKESKTSNTEVCGFPLTKNIFTETGKVCRLSKKKCVKHYSWEKLRRANIDMERVRQCLKLDELVEQERQVRLAMTNRAGVLGLMLHSTYDHEYAVKMQHQQQQQQHQHQQRQTDHQYHQRDKSQQGGDFHHKQFKDSTNYYNHLHHHQLSSDHHYHRQQPENSQETNKLLPHSSKKHQSKYNAASTPASNSVYGNKNHSSFQNNKGTNQSQNQPYHADHYYETDHQFNHDHQYFSSQPTMVDKWNDHLYYSSKRHK